MQNSEQTLEQVLTNEIEGEVRFDAYSQALYSTDASLYQIDPIGVVVPKNTQDVNKTVQIAAQRKIPILPRGGGTSLAGQSVGEAIVIDMSKFMNECLEINADEHWARVQPGIVLDELNHQLKPHGLMYAPDVATSSRANVGGTIGNNSAGSHSLIYGKTIDHVMSLDLILANGDEIAAAPLSLQDLEVKKESSTLEGNIYRELCRICSDNEDEIRKRYPKILRRVAGYNLDEFVTDAGSKEVTPYRRDGCDTDHPFNLAKIVVGSEGTLTTIVEAKINLVPIPKNTCLCVVHFDSLITSMEAMQPILDCKPTAVELIDKTILSMAQGSIEFSRLTSFIQGKPEALLAVEFYGENDDELNTQIDKLEDTLKLENFGYAFVRCFTAEEKAQVWETRKAGLGLLMGMKGDAKPIGFVEDAAVAIEKLPEYVTRFDKIVKKHDTTASYYAHASVGLLHNRPVINLKSESDIHKMHSIAREVRDLLLDLGGAMSGEHGDGLVRSEWIESMFGPQIYQALRDVKNAFDPDGIMNPGKIIDPPSMTENLRFGPKYNTINIETYFDYSAQDGFNRAIEMCNGVGACRKTLTGTMCPSFIATREEEHSTRGRANALRSVISGSLPTTDFTSERLYDVLDLCLGCKACKAECPSNVDMAKIKYEVMAHYRKANGLPLRNRLFGEIGSLAGLGSTFAPFSNWATNNPLSKWFAEKLMGIDRRRDMPTFVHSTFENWFKKRRSQNSSDKKVVLFHDTFMNYSEPNIGKATVHVLESAGYEVILPEKRCCGRPLISEGMLDRAIDNANFNIDQLHKYTEKGIPIVGCEPSCTSALNDDYVDLINTPKARQVADATFSIEEFLVKVTQDENIQLLFNEQAKDILLHGHCHQRALVGAQPVKQMLEIPGNSVDIIDSSCCGMAGSFGYEKSHYDISMRIGELRLFPSIRETSGDCTLTASGFSCRHQIEHGTGILPKHPIEVLSEAIEDNYGL
ncbi:anaerobic glycerol-3-phosphate dehydrogenase subunit C [Candidatus Poribacteria bacterium]|nr:anaerobic glycerol-3-phosphate dehydrogenase subunit C [Candidatus Poribacteria bacterium]